VRRTAATGHAPVPDRGGLDRELAQERDRHRVRLVALLRSWQKLALDLRGTQRYIADDAPGFDVT
jgi:hypothetical protein